MQQPGNSKRPQPEPQTGSGLQVLCHEVERQLNRHYRGVLGFFKQAFADRADYPLRPEQAVMLFCISNGVCDIAQLWQTTEPVTGQSVTILAGLYAGGYVISDSAAETTLQLTAKGEAVADALYELYTYVYLAQRHCKTPDTSRLAALHKSLHRLQTYHWRQQIIA